MVVMLLVLLALLSFGCGALGVQASVAWDQLGKLLLCAALLAYLLVGRA